MKFLLHLLDRRPHLQSTLWIQGWVGTFLGETQPRQTYADDHITNSSYACKRIKGGFLKRIAKKTFGSPGSADSLSSVNPSAAVNLGRWRRTSTPIYNLYWLILHLLGKLTNFPQESRYPWISKLFGYQNHEGESGVKPTFPQSISLSFKIQGADSSWPFNSIPIILQCHQLFSHKSKARISLWKMLVKVLP